MDRDQQSHRRKGGRPSERSLLLPLHSTRPKTQSECQTKVSPVRTNSCSTSLWFSVVLRKALVLLVLQTTAGELVRVWQVFATPRHGTTCPGLVLCARGSASARFSLFSFVSGRPWTHNNHPNTTNTLAKGSSPPGKEQKTNTNSFVTAPTCVCAVEVHGYGL